jgi:hypothetical protein
MISTFLRRTALVALALVASCGSGDPDSGSPSALRVLFIGNSHTQVNNLPDLVADMARASGKAFEYDVEVQGGFGLEDHWGVGNAQRKIREGDYDVVVLQQGPSALPESQANLRQWGQTFAELIREHGGRPAFYMVWPSADRAFDRDGVRTSYTNAAEATDGILAPAGEVWREAWRTDRNLPLYDTDGVHGSLLGTYAAALSVYGQLFGVSPVGVPAPAAITPGVATLLQESARVANETYGRR